jgi:ATP-dependent Clp protease ATP-binding subunit ClpA
MANFDRFTNRARKVLQLSQEEARRFNHDYIGTEHLLLGLVREGDGVAARVLTNMNCQLPKVRSAVQFIIGRSNSPVEGAIALTPRAMKVLQLAVEESLRLNHSYVGTEHLLLGLLREGEGIAAGVLESLGVNLEKVRTQVLLILGQAAEGSRPPLAAAQRLEAGHGPTIEELSPQTLVLFARAIQDATARGHERTTTSHLLLALLNEETAPLVRVKDELGARCDELRAITAARLAAFDADAVHPQTLSIALRYVLQASRAIPRLFRQSVIEPEHLLLALAWTGAAVGRDSLGRTNVSQRHEIAEAQLLVDLESDWNQIERILIPTRAEPQESAHSDEPRE